MKETPRNLRCTIAVLAVLLVAGSALAVNYTSLAAGNWSNSATWTPTGVPGAGDSAIVNHRVVVDSNRSIINITVGNTGKLVNTACTLRVFGNWTNNGADSLRGSIVMFVGNTASSTNGSKLTSFWRLIIAKDTLTRVVTMNQSDSVNYNGAGALSIRKGTLATNGQNLFVNAAGSSIEGDTYGRLDISGASVVNVYHLNQSNGAGGLAYVTLSGSPVVNVAYRHAIGNNNNAIHRFDMSAGTINYLAGSELYLIVNGITGGWFATGGVANFYGNIRHTMVSRFQATGTAVVNFVGTTTSNIWLGDAWGGWQRDAFYLNDLRIAKSAGCTTKFTCGGTMLVDTSICANVGLTVNAGNVLVLACSTFRNQYGYVFNNVTNNGTIIMGGGNSYQATKYVYVNGDWIDQGTFTSPVRSQTWFQTAGTKSLTCGANSYFWSVRLTKPTGGLTVNTGLRVRDSLKIKAGTFPLGKHTLTLGSDSSSATVTVDSAGTFTAIGGTDTGAVVTAKLAAYPYRFTVGQNGTIGANYATFSYPDTFGINIASNAAIDLANRFSNCSFEHGSITGPLLKVENAQNLDSIWNVNFSATAGYNIEKLANTGHITVASGAGTYWGADYERDPNGRIDWIGPDVGVRALMIPSGTLDSGITVTPACSVYNYGTTSATYPVRMKIGAAYDNTVGVSSHAPGAALYLTFPAWTALPRGALAVTCSTELTGDVRKTNDKRTGTVFVRVFDVGALAITAPTGDVDSGVAVTTIATIRNYGNADATFDIRFTSDDGYVSTINRFVAAGADSSFAFADWTPVLRGSRALKCSTRLATDVAPDNDFAGGTANVNVHDIGPTAIVTPAGGIGPGPVTPQARLHNFGTVREACAVTFLINALPQYTSTVSLPDGLPVGLDTVIDFASWTAAPGSYQARCSTYLAGDQVPGNDITQAGFSVGEVDMAVLAITAPPGMIDTARVVFPAARLQNLGEFAASFYTYFAIESAGGQAYLESLAVVGLPIATETLVTFPEWVKPHLAGNYTTRCSVYLAGDVNPGNDVMNGILRVVNAAPDTGWHQMADVPGGAKNKGVKDGGCLAQNPEPESTDANVAFVYLLKGNGRCEFYKYNTETNVWTTKESIPAIGSSGKKKPVKKGGAMTQAAGKMYAAKGNSTSEWWQYDPALSGTPTYPWTQKLDVPAGVKPVLKEGTGAAAVTIGDTAYVYLLRGAGGSELLRYNTLSNTWTAMTPAPVGTSGKPYKDGSALTASLDGKTLYAVKGSYNEFFAYSVDSNRWSTKEPLPLYGTLGKKKKIKSGGALAYYPGGASCEGVYCLKGNNTQEFWKYVQDTDKWVQQTDIPAAVKRVKGGGALVYVPTPGLDQGGDNLYATIGNGTLGFFRYPPTTAPIAVSTGNSSVLGSDKPQAEGFRFEVTPNPFTTATCIRYTLPQAGNATIKLYDITGQLVTTLASGYHTTGTHTLAAPTSLAHGIYVLKLTTDNTTATRKLIVE